MKGMQWLLESLRPPHPLEEVKRCPSKAYCNSPEIHEH